MTKQLSVVGNWTQEDLQTMKETLTVNASDSQFQLFLRTAHASGLNPFLNHIYGIVYQGKMSLQIGIEGISYLAKQHKDYEGWDAQTVCANDEFKARRVKDEHGRDNWEITTHEIGFPRGNIIGCYAIAYRKDFRPFTVLIDWEEVEHFQKSSIPNQQTMWKKYTADMFKKHCGKRALKGQFGIDINEDDVVNSEPSINNMDSYNRVDVTPTEKPAETLKEAPKTNAPQVDESTKKMDAARALMNKKFIILDIVGKEGKGAYISSKITLEDGQPPTYEQMEQLLKMMDADIKAKNELSDELE